MFLDMLLVYYLQKTKVWSKNIKILTYWNAFMINTLKNSWKTNLEHQFDNVIW